MSLGKATSELDTVPILALAGYFPTKALPLSPTPKPLARRTIMSDTYYTVEFWDDVWFKTDDEDEAYMFLCDRADEEPSLHPLYLIRHQNGKRKVIYTAMERFCMMYGD